MPQERAPVVVHREGEVAARGRDAGAGPARRAADAAAAVLSQGHRPLAVWLPRTETRTRPVERSVRVEDPSWAVGATALRVGPSCPQPESAGGRLAGPAANASVPTAPATATARLTSMVSERP